MDGGHGECSGLLVGVVELVEVFVEEGHVVDPVVPVGDVVRGNEDQGALYQGPQHPVLSCQRNNVTMSVVSVLVSTDPRCSRGWSGLH